MQSKQVLRVVLASPGDVQAERDVMDDIVHEINILLRAIGKDALLELWRWETDGRPGMHRLGPQGRLDEILRIEDADILIGVFWQRLGTPALGARSGTEHELSQAIAAWKSKGSPKIMLYFRDDRQGPPPDDEQYQALMAFEKELRADEKPLVWHYTDVSRFRSVVKDHLHIEAMNLIDGARLPTLGLSVEAHPIPVRAEGLTELLGSVFVGFTYNGAVVPANELFLTVMVYLILPVTSRPEQRNPRASQIDAVLFEVGRPNETSPIRGRLISPGVVMFEGIRLKDLRPGDCRVFQITNLRCNANVVAPGGSIVAHVTATGASVEKPLTTVGTVIQGLVFTVNDASGWERLPGAGFHIGQGVGLPPSRIATLRFEEGFRGAFKARIAQAPRMSESCFFGSLHLREGDQVVFSGAADTGTRLKAWFHNLPAGLRLFVSTSSLLTSSSLPASYIGVQIVKERTSLIPGSVLFVGLDQMQELLIVDGVARAVWEVVQPNTDPGDHPGHVDVAICVASVPGSSATVSHDRTAIVNGSFDPTPWSDTFTTTTGGMASMNLPIPRFADTSRAFAIINIEGG